MAQLLKLTKAGVLSPNIRAKIPWSDVETAHQLLVHGEVHGKVLLAF